MWSNRYRAGQTHNPPLFHKIDTWNQGVNEVNDYFEVKRPTSVVIAPGSDMPYCLVHWVEGVPGNGDGWPAQAANPAAYVSLHEPNQDSDEITWHPILLSHQPVTLMPGYYVPALPQMAYAGDQFDAHHAWPTTAFEWPEVILMESNFPVEMSYYQFTTKERTATTTENYYTPWLIEPQGTLIASDTNLTWSKAVGVGGSNRTGSDQTATSLYIITKDRTDPDTAVGTTLYQDYNAIGPLLDGGRTNIFLERFGWIKLRLKLNAENDFTPAGVGYIIA